MRIKLISVAKIHKKNNILHFFGLLVCITLHYNAKKMQKKKIFQLFEKKVVLLQKIVPTKRDNKSYRLSDVGKTMDA